MGMGQFAFYKKTLACWVTLWMYSYSYLSASLWTGSIQQTAVCQAHCMSMNLEQGHSHHSQSKSRKHRKTKSNRSSTIRHMKEGEVSVQASRVCQGLVIFWERSVFGLFLGQSRVVIQTWGWASQAAGPEPPCPPPGANPLPRCHWASLKSCLHWLF